MAAGAFDSFKGLAPDLDMEPRIPLRYIAGLIGAEGLPQES